MNSGDVTAICAAGAFIFTVLCAVIKGIVDGAIGKALTEQRKWLTNEFKDVRKWQNEHVRDDHGRPQRPQRQQTPKS